MTEKICRREAEGVVLRHAWSAETELQQQKLEESVKCL